MLTVTKEDNGDHLVVHLSGSIDETVDFAQLIGEPKDSLTVFCKQVHRINSVGIKNWIRFFTTVLQNKVKLRFEEFSIELVEQINVVKNFHCGAEIGSIIVPFRCTKCETSLRGKMKVEDVKTRGFQIPPIKCPKCSAQAEFDDYPDEYFSFLMR